MFLSNKRSTVTAHRFTIQQVKRARYAFFPHHRAFVVGTGGSHHHQQQHTSLQQPPRLLLNGFHYVHWLPEPLNVMTSSADDEGPRGYHEQNPMVAVASSQQRQRSPSHVQPQAAQPSPKPVQQQPVVAASPWLQPFQSSGQSSKPVVEPMTSTSSSTAAAVVEPMSTSPTHVAPIEHSPGLIATSTGHGKFMTLSNSSRKLTVCRPLCCVLGSPEECHAKSKEMSAAKHAARVKGAGKEAKRKPRFVKLNKHGHPPGHSSSLAIPPVLTTVPPKVSGLIYLPSIHLSQWDESA